MFDLKVDVIELVFLFFSGFYDGKITFETFIKRILNVSFEENMYGTFSKQIQRRWVVFSMFGYLLYLRPFGRYEVLVPYKVLVKL